MGSEVMGIFNGIVVGVIYDGQGSGWRPLRFYSDWMLLPEKGRE